MLGLGDKRPEKIKVSHRAEALVVGVLRWVLCRLGPRISYGLFRRFLRPRLAKSGPVATIERNIEQVFQDREPEFRHALKERVVDGMSDAMTEFALQDFWHRRSLQSTEHNLDAPWLQPYLRNEKPAIYLIGHFQGWEVNILTLTGFVRNVLGIYRPPKNPLLEVYFRDRRTVDRSGMDLVPRDYKGLGKRLAGHLASGGSLMYALDAPLPGPMLPFLGLKSPTTLVPYGLAAQHKVPIIPLKCGKRGQGRFFIEVLDPLFAGGETAEDIEALAVQMNAIYSDWIREMPEQWYWADKFFIPNDRWEARRSEKP